VKPLQSSVFDDFHSFSHGHWCRTSNEKTLKDIVNLITPQQEAAPIPTSDAKPLGFDPQNEKL